ncbi:hypothetical protein DR66_2365 [Delftia acidovorans]|uniref:hypothetical protein n=1 Tax=Delftia acidovorans TaxID=80866 RepID=UPI000501BF5E|nr:hypothetical protein [Delftia acidovorans]KFJ09162.1 hypothetical protein DR66_2365 [Delftia acidovorans]QQB52559.1 hypothetical protein I6H54_09995 [Delftia acidovorans]
MKIDKELIGPAATLAAAILSKVERQHSEFDRDVIASAFEEAYFTLLEGIQRVEKELARTEKPTEYQVLFPK